MNEEQVLHAMSIDDAYTVERVLARSNLGVTEVVTFEGVGPFVRKKIPLKLAQRNVWATLAECSNPRLPQIAVTYEMPDQFIVVYDYIPGDTLEQVVAGNGRLAIEEALSVAYELAEAAADLHRHGLVHCDLAPGNIIIAADGAHVIDFGIAQHIGTRSTSDAKTATLGTWGFAAPEQYGFASADQRSDIYSLSRLVGYMVSGYLPDQEQFNQWLLSSSVPQPLQDFLSKGTAFEPSARFQTCDEFVQALDQLRYALGLTQSTSSQPTISHLAAAQSAPQTVAASQPGAQSAPQAVAASQPGAQPGVQPTPQPTPAPHNGAPQNSAAESTSRNAIGQAWRTLDRKKKAALIGGGAAVVVLLVVLMVFVFQMANNPADSAPQQADSSSSLTEKSASSVPNSTEAGSSSEAGASLESMLVITESGWTADEYGVVHFGITLQNTDSNYGVEVPAISIVGKSEDGTILFSEEQSLMYIQPGETVCYGSTAGDGSAIPATVEFKALAPNEYDLVPAEASDNARFRIDNAHARAAHGGMTFTGEVALDSGTYPEQGMFGVLVTVILRDEAGNIVYGNSIDAGKPSRSSSVPFEISCFDAPDYATYELYAQVW